MKYLMILIILLFSPISFAKDYGKGKMAPLQGELLENPIYLQNVCENVKIIEWRPTDGKDYTKHNDKSIKILTQICELVVRKFVPFVRSKGYIFDGDTSKFETSLCLMPLDSKPRNLNDTIYRFVNRPEKDVWGYYHFTENNVYLRNDVLTYNKKENKKTIIVFAHELFHSLSFNFGIFEQHSGDKFDKEEKLARSFTMTILGSE